MVEEAYRSNAGVVGPKLVSAEDPELLLEVGRAIDRFGAPHTGIEPGEVDQEQHDGVRDVFYVSSAAMLVRVDLLQQLEGFDPATFPGSEDLDLCWRARLAGARVLVVPDARVAHREAADDRLRGDRPDEFALSRTRVRVLFTSYSLLTLLWLVPVGIVVGFVEAVGDLLTGRPRRARAAIGAWLSNLVHVRRLRASRRRAQSLRHVHDRDLRELQVGSITRLNAFVAHHLHGDERLRSFGSRGRLAVDSVSDGLRSPAALAFVGFVAMVVFGSRDLDQPRRAVDRHDGHLAECRLALRRVRLGVALHRSRLRLRSTSAASGHGRTRNRAAGFGRARSHAGGGRGDAAGRIRHLPARATGRRAARPGVRGGHGLRGEPARAQRDRRRSARPARDVRHVPVPARSDHGDRASRRSRSGTTARAHPPLRAAACVHDCVVSPRARVRGGGGARDRDHLAVHRWRRSCGPRRRHRHRRHPWCPRVVVPVAARLRGCARRSRVARLRVPPRARRVAGDAFRHRPGRCRLGDVGLGGGGRGALVPRHWVALAWTARGWALALAGWALVWVPSRFAPHVSVPAPEAGLVVGRTGSGARARGGRVGARRRDPQLPLRMAPTGGDHRRARRVAALHRIHRGRGQRSLGRTRDRLERHARLHVGTDRARSVPHAVGGQSDGAAARSGRARRWHRICAHPQRSR